MSIFGSAAAIVAAVLVPSANRIEMLPPPETTWLAVSTVPASVTITPDPSEPFEVVIITTDGTIWRYISVTGSGVAVTAGVGVGVSDARLAEVMGNIVGTTSYEEFGDVDFVIEAVPEKMEIKHAVFEELDAATPGHAILASNTSGLSITEIGDATDRPDKVVGFHFFWPASYMRLIEVIEGEDTSPETVQAAANFAQAIKKMPVRCRECPGFVVNRILASTASEIWRYQDETGIGVEELDRFITEKAQMPMGPFRVADMSGLDTVVKVARDMQEAYGDRFYVHKGMEEMVERGELGAKSGKGFYEHA